MGERKFLWRYSGNIIVASNPNRSEKKNKTRKTNIALLKWKTGENAYKTLEIGEYPSSC